MLDRDLAELYGVSTTRLNEQVKRNIKRFPEDFMFQITPDEFKNLISHIATSSWGGTRKMPLAFTEQGVAMLSSVLNSERAITVNIAIMRVFVRLRQILYTHKEFASKLNEHSFIIEKHGEKINRIFGTIQKLTTPLKKSKIKIGFRN
jgi:hypothetical protein